MWACRLSVWQSLSPLSTEVVERAAAQGFHTVVVNDSVTLKDPEARAAADRHGLRLLPVARLDDALSTLFDLPPAGGEDGGDGDGAESLLLDLASAATARAAAEAGGGGGGGGRGAEARDSDRG